MKTKNILRKLMLVTLNVMCIMVMISCESEDDFLKEIPKDFLAPENTFVDKANFEAALVTLYDNTRGIHCSNQGLHEKEWEVFYGQGADIGYHINKKDWITDYGTVNSSNRTARSFWLKFYSIIKDANVIINRAEGEQVTWDSEADKNEIVSSARFFRAYAYRCLVSFYGGVPLITEEISAPKFDFVRATVDQVWALVLEDLQFAKSHLPTANPTGATLSKAAANYLIAETYLVMKQWDNAIAATNEILNDGQYDLMTSRFGSMTDKPGDPYWDLYRLGNQDRTSGNKENIFAWQYEFDVPGGHYNAVERAWGPFLEKLKSPDNRQAILKDEFLGRPVVFIRITPWVETGMWDDFNGDMRNSEYNVKRDFYINNPASANFGELIVPTAANYVRNQFPYYQKFTHPYGHPQGYDSGGRIYTDWYLFRVAGVYLLQAEAYLGKGDQTGAAKAINVVRGRANATLVAPGNVDVDYLLDERARELLGEEARRIVLNRMGKLVERTKLHNPISGINIQAHNDLLPIPQTEIDINDGSVLEQNPGY